MQTKTIYLQNKKTRKRSRLGGKAFDSGGYGCIFKPELSCLNKTKKNLKNVTKLSLKKDSIEEYNNIQLIKQKLQSIPNYKNKYFISNIEKCNVDKLTENDKINYNRQCKSLIKKGITKENVNKKLNKLFAINMPFAGQRLDDWIVSKAIDNDRMKKLNKIIFYFLKVAIIPMNKKNVIHNDIKDDNLMIYNDKYHIIDWGLSSFYEKNKIPEQLINRPLQFNVPFSCVLFHKSFQNKYKIFLEKNVNNNQKPNHFGLKYFLLNLYFLKQENYYGNSSENIGLMKMLFYHKSSKKIYYDESKDTKEVIEFMMYLNLFLNYNADILLKFTNFKTKKFDALKYLNDVYIYNTDIFGLISCYLRLFDYKKNKLELKFKNKDKILNIIKEMFIDNILINGDKKINVSKIYFNIKKINSLLHNNNKTKKIKQN